MSLITATTPALHHVDAGLATAPLVEEPQYRYAGEGRWLPANNSARDECARWNNYADAWNQRTAARRSLRQ